MPTEYQLTSPSSLYECHPQFRVHEGCTGVNCKRGSCRLQQMIQSMENGNLTYDNEERIDVTQFTHELHELHCPLVAGVLGEVHKLDYPTSKSKPTQHDLVLPSVQLKDTYTGAQMIALEGTIIMKYSHIRSGSGQEGYETLLEMCGDRAVEWAGSTPSEKEVIAVRQPL
jgi:hypothetical protein